MRGDTGGAAHAGARSAGDGARHTPGRAADAFRTVYGRDPEGLWAAPGRVNLIGEHTDYNDGFVMPLALPHTTVVAAAARTDGVLAVHSGDPASGVARRMAIADLPALARAGAPGTARDTGAAPRGWARYPGGVVWALGEAGFPVRGADLHFESTVPIGAGLSSSAALEVATAAALNDLFDLRLTPTRMALLAQRAENAFVGVPSGVMDQTASACCTEGHALHLDTRDLTIRHLPFDLAADGLCLLVIDTRVRHALAEGGYAERRAGCERGAARLGVTSLREVDPGRLPDALATLSEEPRTAALVRHVVTENERVAQAVGRMAAGDPAGLGPVLAAGHVSLRDDFQVSCPELDLAVDVATAAGALGARMTGAGFGGSAIALVARQAAERVGAAVTEAFARAGYRVPQVFTAVPSSGTRRLR